jgi:dTMP kinase
VEPVLELNRVVTGGLMPDRTFVLLVDAEAARSRQGRELDRIEREDEGFRGAVAAAYRRLETLFPERIVALDGSAAPAKIAEQVRVQVRAR